MAAIFSFQKDCTETNIYSGVLYKIIEPPPKKNDDDGNSEQGTRMQPTVHLVSSCSANSRRGPTLITHGHRTALILLALLHMASNSVQAAQVVAAAAMVAVMVQVAAELAEQCLGIKYGQEGDHRKCEDDGSVFI